MEDKTYTIDEIRAYIISQDSLGDVLYNLKNIDTVLEGLKDEEEVSDYTEEDGG